MNSINGQLFKTMLLSAGASLSNHFKEVDALNVFPVPDGDTGTNMSMTLTSGVTEGKNCASENVGEIAKKFSRGLLMGARGNSGVILSQIFRGFANSVKEKEEITTEDLANGFIKGKEVAYKAVMRPVEGTILTVIREGAEAAKEYYDSNPDCSIEDYFHQLVSAAKISLQNTPNLLPVLKEVGVVDSGGAGLVYILEGLEAAVKGTPITECDNTEEQEKLTGYTVEFTLALSETGKNNFSEKRFKNSLEAMADSVELVAKDDKVIAQIKTATPGEVITSAQRHGEFEEILVSINANKPQLLYSEETFKAVALPKTKYAIITVCAGEGLKNTFKEYRCDVVISGGQTMNPSTEDFISAIKSVNAEHIIILPNNSNIILAAQQAAALQEGQDIIVLPTKTIPQGLSACLMYNPEADVEENLNEMNEAIANVRSGQVTYAIKDTVYEGLEIKAGDYMGIKEKEIVISTDDKLVATCKLVNEMMDEDCEIVTLIVGEGTTQNEIDVVTGYIEKNYDVEVEIIQGDQPVYSFFIGIE